MNHPVQGCGIGLRFQHIDTIADSKPPIPWLDVLTDNYLLPGSVQQDYLFEMAEHYPLTFHGVGMSLGSTDPLDTEYFSRVKALVERVNPAWVSDHLLLSNYAIHTVWLAHQPEDHPEKLPLERIQIQQQTYVLVWRKGRRLQQVPLDKRDWEFLTAVQQRETLPELAGRFKN